VRQLDNALFPQYRKATALVMPRINLLIIRPENSTRYSRSFSGTPPQELNVFLRHGSQQRRPHDAVNGLGGFEGMITFFVISVVIAAASAVAAAVSILALRCLFWMMASDDRWIEVYRVGPGSELREAA
jgi:hypothetical protein